MKKTIFTTIYFVIVFLLACFIIGRIMNHGNTDMTMEMSKASLPVIQLNIDGFEANELHGYSSEMDISYMRDCLTIVSSNRTVKYKINCYEENVKNISFEVRSVDGSRLVENTICSDYIKKEQMITGEIVIKDLIDSDREYMLVFILNLEDGREIRYYTRLLQSENYHIEEKLKYVKNFHEKTFQKANATELTKYLESNSKGDNTTFHEVNIHSSFKQVTWGALEIEKVTDPVICIKEQTPQIGYFELKYLAQIKETNQIIHYYNITEQYRIRYTSDRIYLLDYERTMDQIFDEEDEVYVNDKIMLGITGEDVQMKESEGGNVLAFVSNGKLYSYHVIDNKMVRIFSFYEEDLLDPRGRYDQHEIKILSVDETGNVDFIVYGYMNRGRHEGEVGVATYRYNSMLNTVEELAYMPYYKSFQILKHDLNNLSYINKTGKGYFMLDGNVYEINLESFSINSIVEGLAEGSYQISETHQMLAWQNGNKTYQADQINLMDLSSGQKTLISAGINEYIMPLGFMDDDIIYGLAKKEDVVKDSSGITRFPMYKIVIADQNEDILKEYQQNDVYIMSCNIEGNQITLNRATRGENGQYEEIIADQIMNTEEVKEGNNTIVAAITEEYEKIIQIQLKSEIKGNNTKLLTPKEVLFEGNRRIDIEEHKETNGRYYVYGLNGIHSIYKNPANALMKAYNNAGIVVGENGEYIWMKGNRVSKNQIMAIIAPEKVEEGESLANCLDMMLQYEGISINSSFLLARGFDALEILSDNLKNAQVLNLTGCSLDAVLYYVNMDIPVLVMLQNNEAVVVTGFNESQVVIYDPAKGTLYKLAMDDADLWFSENGSEYITYIRNQE